MEYAIFVIGGVSLLFGLIAIVRSRGAAAAAPTPSPAPVPAPVPPSESMTYINTYSALFTKEKPN